MFGIYQKRKKVNFLFIIAVKGGKLNFFPSHFTIILLGSVRLVAIIFVLNSLHLENGL